MVLVLAVLLLGIAGAKFDKVTLRMSSNTTNLVLSISAPLTSGLVLIGLLAGPAAADDLTVSDDRTSSADTTSGDGNGPGDITVDGTGSIDVTSGIAVTINSDNSLTNNGLIQNTAESGAIGVLIDGSVGDLSGSISNSGQINIPGPEDGSAIENQPAINTGIQFNGPGTLTGSISNNAGGDILVGGNASYGLNLQSDIVGDIINNSRIATSGVESTTVNITGAIDGSITNTGDINATGRDGIGLYLGGSLSGTITHNGGIDSGLSSFRDVDFNLIPEASGEAGIWIAGSVGGGLQILGNQVTEALEQELEVGDPALSIGDADISVIGDGQLIRVKPGGASGTLNDITLGVVGSGDNAFAILNQGVMSVGGTTEGINVEGITIEGLVSGGTIYTTTLNGGLRNAGGDIRAGTTDGTSVAIRIGDYGTVPAINNSGDILSVTNDSTENTVDGIIGDIGGDATAIIVDQNGSLTSVTNSGIIEANAAGSGSSAFAIIDRAGTLTSLTNTGDVRALIRDGSTGTTTALDVRTSTNDFTFFNSGNVAGDIYLGDGNDTFTVTGGSVAGTVISLAGGNDTVSLSDTSVTGTFAFTNGLKTASVMSSSLVGGFTKTGAIIDLVVDNTDWTLPADAGASLRNLDIQGGTTLRIEVDGVNNQAGTLSATDTANIAADTTIVPVLRSFITDQQTFVLVQAGQLNSGIVLNQAVPASTSYIHSTAVVRDDTDPNTILLQVTRRSAEDLGLTTNMGTLFDNAGDALSQDSSLFTSLAAITDQVTFEDALRQFVPDTSNAVIQSALNQQNMALGAINRRLDRVPAQGFYRDRPTVWLQPMGHYAKRKAEGEELGYTTWSGGIAIGTDRQVGEMSRAGIAYTQLWSFPDELSSFDRPTEFSSSQLNGYLRTGNNIRHLQGNVTFGYDSFNSERNVRFDSIDRTTLGDWNGYQIGSAIQLALGTKRGNFSFIPMARVSYLRFHQGSYLEENGGNGLNLDVASNDTDSLRGSLGLAGRQAFIREDGTSFELEFRGNYTREFMTGTRDLEVSFATSNAPFILEGQPLTQDVFSLGFGVFYKNDHATISFDYDGEKASGYTAHTGAVTVRFRF